MSRDKALDWLKKHDPEAIADPKSYARRIGLARAKPREVAASDLSFPDGDNRAWDEAGVGREFWDDYEHVVAEESHPDVLRPDAPRSRKGPPFEAMLETALSADELRHWRWLAEGRLQNEIRADLGISQPAVSKREVKLRDKVDKLHRAFDGRPYPWFKVSSKRGGRARRL